MQHEWGFGRLRTDGRLVSESKVMKKIHNIHIIRWVNFSTIPPEFIRKLSRTRCESGKFSNHWFRILQNESNNRTLNHFSTSWSNFPYRKISEVESSWNFCGRKNLLLSASLIKELFKISLRRTSWNCGVELIFELKFCEFWKIIFISTTILINNFKLFDYVFVHPWIFRIAKGKLFSLFLVLPRSW